MRKRPGSAKDPLWYKDAIIYEAHVRCFFDSTNDGVGDFPGFTQKLDYLQGLGVTAIWLLPFYPSPLRDDGYDISLYEGIHPSYGTLRDFKTFLREAHRRGIQVITELVINHTSDQHPWFQAARRAPAGTPKRDYYVWSETRQKYAEARIIFSDSEQSNWTWDTEANAHYWHRFFHHQPDLNYDNPHVRRAIAKVMRFWFDLGVDGMRLDAVPYLIEREGTNCENLLETHEVLKAIRRELDDHYENRMLLAEANQWPADVRAYFGDGDECHMGFHFPLMPRMFMALRQEDRHPVTEILRQTPDIPETAQWALFLRNHDELTLEMVTDEERDYMYQAYAADPQMRINAGIRRRLAPLVENSRRRIELLNSLLFSLPGTPVIYYGDEIGMGDNVYLGDRNGVRTPMQWTSDRNGGFSRADPARLYAPPIMDPVYGYQSINVEAQERSIFSLLNWMTRMIALRKQHKTFSRGTIEILAPANRRVLAYVRRHDAETILCVSNLSRTVQPVELDLQGLTGLTPVEMLGGAELPIITESPYFLTLSPYGFLWFRLERQPVPIAARVAPLQPAPLEEKPALLAGSAWERLLDGNVRTLIERDLLVPFLMRQRWFGGKSRAIDNARFTDWGLLIERPEPTFLTIVEVTYAEGSHDAYFVPLAVRADGEAVAQRFPAQVLGRVTGARKGVIFDGALDPLSAQVLLDVVAGSRSVNMRTAHVRAFPTSAFAQARGTDALPATPAGAEQSNTSIVYGSRLILKLFRRLEAGVNPDFEIGRYLTERARFARVPAVAGALEYAAPGQAPATVGMLQRLVTSQGNGWDHAIQEVGLYYERSTQALRRGSVLDVDPSAILELAARPTPPEVCDAIGGFIDSAATLGKRTAELHRALAEAREDAAFAPAMLSRTDLKQLASAMEAHGRVVLDVLASRVGTLPDATARNAEKVLGERERLLFRFRALEDLDTRVAKIRIHGDYHLGQVLWVENDFVILDFEGEPTRPLSERRALQLALKDVGGMLRSYDYAAYVGLLAHTHDRPADHDRLEPWARAWARWTATAFLGSYLTAAAGDVFLPEDPAGLLHLLEAFVLDKALYELQYELNNRPEWVHIPLWGMLPLVER
jgi:maltose alpha-D-glucosyltransferase/alpha-amylase